MRLIFFLYIVPILVWKLELKSGVILVCRLLWNHSVVCFIYPNIAKAMAIKGALKLANLAN